VYEHQLMYGHESPAVTVDGDRRVLESLAGALG
jgi:hypothetical protein